MLICGDHDDRVPPLHSYKFLATLQENGDPKSTYQLYLIPGAGHGGALTAKDWIDKLLFKYYFLFDQLDLKFYWFKIEIRKLEQKHKPGILNDRTIIDVSLSHTT